MVRKVCGHLREMDQRVCQGARDPPVPRRQRATSQTGRCRRSAADQAEDRAAASPGMRSLRTRKTPGEFSGSWCVSFIHGPRRVFLPHSRTTSYLVCRGPKFPQSELSRLLGGGISFINVVTVTPSLQISTRFSQASVYRRVAT